MLVFVMIPFWTNFLVRNYAWRVILGNDGPLMNTTEFLGLGSVELLLRRQRGSSGSCLWLFAFMILPLYAAIERIDRRLLEASRDLYGTGRQSFRHVFFPLSMPGVIAGSILVFVPSLGAYVTPEILGGVKQHFLKLYSHPVPYSEELAFGAALSFVLMLVMLITTIVYFRKGGRTL